MCGIAGIFSFTPFKSDSLKQRCLHMLERLEHRGPDAHGLHQDEGAVLGHRRLSIIDFSERANQPISNEDGTVWLVFNGEIYNYRELRERLLAQGHRFKSQTDSEVIVHLYEAEGIDCLRHLRGMFAFALWDANQRRLLLARDRFGIKPLYYAASEDVLVFASETKAVLESGLVSSAVKTKSVIQFLKFGSVPAPDTIYESVQCLPAGSYLLADARGFRAQSYWNLESILNASGESFSIQDLNLLFQETVNQHLLSDAPVGIMLSGGLDSSALTAAASVSGKRVKTLNVSFPDTPEDESQYAKMVSAHFHTDHMECAMSAEELNRQIPSFLQAMDQPAMDGFNAFVVAKAAKETGLKVLLSGLGGDELFLGYDHFRHVQVLSRTLKCLQAMSSGLREPALNLLIQAAHMSGRYGARRMKYLKGFSVQNIYEVCRGVFPPETLERVSGQNPFIPLEPASFQTDGLSPVTRAVYFEMSHYLHDQLLRDSDVFGMAHSVEIRVPFLDHIWAGRVLPLSLSKRFSCEPKGLLKKMMESALPQKILKRRKRGFTFPMGAWMRSYLKKEIEETLLASHWDCGGLSFRRPEIETLWRQFLNGEIHWSQPWTLFVLKRWFDRSHFTEKTHGPAVCQKT